MIQWHLIGMFAPSALSALLLKRFGTIMTNVAGCIIMASGCAMGTVSSTGWTMTATMMLVGVGWNILFVAGSALLLQSYPQGRGAKLQGFTDGTTAAISATGSFAAASLLQCLGWGGINILSLATTLSLLALVVWLTIRAGRRTTPLPTQSSDLVNADS